MGVHTGDSIVVAPIQTLPDPVVQRLRRCALKIVRALQLEGGCNVQLAVSPDGADYRVIEVNPRVSRSTALASKATGYPIARVAALVALGKRLDELPQPGHRRSARPPSSRPSTTSWSSCRAGRSTSSRSPIGSSGVQMKATGEAMAIDREFGPALLKAVRSLEPRGRGWLWDDPAWGLAHRPPADLGVFLAASRHPAVADGRPAAPWLDRCRRAVGGQPASRPGSPSGWRSWSTPSGSVVGHAAGSRPSGQGFGDADIAAALRRAAGRGPSCPGAGRASRPPTGGSTPAPASSRPRRRTSTRSYADPARCRHRPIAAA